MSAKTRGLGVAEYVTHHVGELPYSEDEIKAAMESYGRHVKKQGAGPGSLESDETAGLDYIVMTASGIQQHLPKLWELYTSREAIEAVELAVGEAVEPKLSGEGGINLNYVKSGGRYELHLDAEPYTMLVFVSTLPDGVGGHLAVFDATDAETPVMTFQPSSGLGVIFDGSVTPHAVTPTQYPRISMPCIYVPVEGREAWDEGDQDAYLYGEH